jgi:hypothetical protein
MLIDGSLRVRGDVIIDGTLIFNSSITINPPACLNTDCINSTSGSGILVLDDLNLASAGNNILITDKINTINPATTGLRINNSYTLPVDALSANVGDVLSLITPAPLATVAFTTPTSATGRVVQNFFQMEEPRTTFNSTSYLPLFISGSGSDIINTADIAVGGSVRFRTKGYLYNGTGGGSTVLGQFELFIGINNTAAAFNYYSTNSLFIRDVGMGTDQTVGRGWWEVHVTVTKIDASNNCTVAVSGLWNAVESTGVNSETFDLQFYDDPSTFTNRLPNTGSSNTLVPLAYWSPLPTPSFKLSLAWKQVSGDARAIATEYTIDYLNTDQNVLATTTAPATDHLTLANLNGGTGDGGHINLYDRRGVKPMTGDVNMNSNNINNVSQVNGQGGLNLMEINNTNGLMLVDGAELRLTADTSIKLYPTVDLRLGAGGSNIIINPSSEVDVQGGINMNNNDITNANVLVRASNGNVINFDNDIAPPLITGALTIESGAGKEININADNILKLNGNSIIHNSGTGPHQFNDSGGLQVQMTSANVEIFKNLDMKNNNIDNVNQVSSSGTLTLLGALGNRCDIGVAGATRLEVEDSRVLISQFADFNIQDQIIYVQPNTMPTLFQDGKTYIFVGSRTTNTPIVLNNINITFKGTSRDTSSIEYTGTGSFITSTDCNLSISDLTLKCNVAGSLLLTASNPSKLKVLSIFNCEVIDTYEFSDISGHELVDINNCLFIHLRGDGVLTNQKCLYINGVAKTNITSCEIVKFFEIGQPANTNPFDGAMIYITGACGAVSIIGGIIHPRVNQRAVEIDNTATFLEFALNTNNFIDIGLTTGAILETNSNASWDTNATSEANSLLPNLKSFVGAQLSAQNTNNTATVLNTPIDINIGTLLLPFAGFGVTVGSGGGVTYNRKRPVNFQVTFVANLQAITGGAGQRVALSTSKNGVNTGIKSFVTLDSAGTEPKQCTLTLIGTATQGDVFRSQLINESTSSNIRCLDLLVSGIEI